MQLTRFDRWLRENFVYETHIQTLRPPDTVPRGIRCIDLPEAPGRRFRHMFVARDNRSADNLIRVLKENGQMYETKVVDRDCWYVPFIAPKDKSLSWWLASVALYAISAFFVLLYLKGLVQDEEFRQNFAESLKILKG